MVNKNYLKYLVAEKGLQMKDLAIILDISCPSLYSKIKGKVEWKLSDMKKIKEFLELSDEDFKKIFGL